MGSAWIVDAVRTPIGKRGGGLASVHAVELGASPLRALVARVGIDPADLDDVVYGCTSALGELGSDVGRLCALDAGFPVSTTGTQINRLDASADQALHFAAMGVVSGHQGLVIAGGVASASRVPMASDRELHGAMATWPEELAWALHPDRAGGAARIWWPDGTASGGPTSKPTPCDPTSGPGRGIMERWCPWSLGPGARAASRRGNTHRSDR